MKTETSQTAIPIYPMPLVRLDLVILAVRGGQLQVLLSHRKEAPYQGKWGLPGGVLRIDLDTTLEAGAQRVATERLGRTLPNLGQVAAVGGAKRDPRAPWAMSVVFRSLVQPELETTPGKRVQALEWRNVEDIAQANDIAFDHAALVEQAVHSVREEVQDFRFATGWVPQEFTLAELQGMSEAVLGVKLDKVTFRRRVDANAVVLRLADKMRHGAFRPAQLYRLSVALN